MLPSYISHWTHVAGLPIVVPGGADMTAILMAHIAAVIIVAAANIGALTTTILARRSTSPRRILTLLHLHNTFAARTLVPAAVVTLVTGAWLTYRAGVSLLAPWMAG